MPKTTSGPCMARTEYTRTVLHAVILPSRVVLVRRACVPLAVLALAVTGCSSSNHKADGSTPSSSSGAIAGSEVGEGTRPRSSAVVALRELLADEQKNDHAASFALVLHGVGQPYMTMSQWRRRRAELPAITAFSVKAGGDGVAIATVEHQPGLEPFRGLSAARERQVWKASNVRGGWLLHAEPDTRLLLPPDSGSKVAALAWARAVQKCDQSAAEKLQGVSTLFGTITESVRLCKNTGDVTVGEPVALSSGPLSADIVAQYTTDALLWARVVPVTAPVQLRVILAPIGNDWKVIGVGTDS